MQEPRADSDSRFPRFREERVEETVAVLQVRGELDIGSAEALRHALDDAEAHAAIVRLDAAGVNFLIPPRSECCWRQRSVWRLAVDGWSC